MKLYSNTNPNPESIVATAAALC